jgi:rod shape-determining protein MreC
MKQFFRNNGVLILVAAVLLAALLALGSFLLGNDPVADALGVLTTPFRSLSTAAAERVQDWYDRAFQYDTLGDANEELRARLAELEGLERDYQDAIRQNEQYRELLGLAEKRSDFVFEQAEITQRSTSSWERTVTLNKGSKHGVEVDDCVVDEYGNLMGIVTQVDYNSCLMATIVDAEVELGGRVARTDENAILEGDFTLMLEGKLKLSYLTEDSQLISGDQITTSGLGLVYPAGLVVGTIESIHTEANGLDRYAVVRPAADLDGQRYVFIIKDFEVVE